MRYCSYQVQKLIHGSSPWEGILNEGYLGIYLRADGLNASRFAGKGQDAETWNALFAYYFELWLVQVMLTTVGPRLIGLLQKLRSTLQGSCDRN